MLLAAAKMTPYAWIWVGLFVLFFGGIPLRISVLRREARERSEARRRASFYVPIDSREWARPEQRVRRVDPWPEPEDYPGSPMTVGRDWYRGMTEKLFDQDADEDSTTAVD